MTEILSGLVGIVLAVIGFVASQYFMKMVIEPVAKVRGAIAKVAVVFLSNQKNIPGGHNLSEELKKEMNKTAAELIASTAEVFWYERFHRFFLLPPKQDIREACHLINMMAIPGEATKPGDRAEAIRGIQRLLDIPAQWGF